MKVLITREIPRSGTDILNDAGLELDYRKGPPLTDSELKLAIKDVDAILPVIPDIITKEVIDAAGENLKIIAAYSVGYDHIDVKHATQKGIYVANTPGDKTVKSVAEHALALMLSLGTKLVDSDQFCRDGKYKYWDPMGFLGTRMVGKTLGIIGFGRIGKSLARMAHGLDMKILYNNIERCELEEKELGAKCVDVEELLQKSDFVSLHVDLNETTRHLISEQQFHLMKPEAILINTARGPVINEEALVKALKAGIIQGAGLDVFEHEPEIHQELLKIPNVILTPHIASGTREVRIQMANLAAQNIVDVLVDNKAPTHLVNKEIVAKILL